MKEEYAKYLIDKTRQNYNLIADEFSRTRSQIWEETRFLIDDYVNKGEKILDLGCGNGRYYEALKSKEIYYFGVDISENLIKIAKEKYPSVDFRVFNGFNLAFSDNYFDKIYCLAVLHHIPSHKLRLEFLKEAKRVLKEKGLLIVAVWKFHQLKEFLLLLKYTFVKLAGKSEMDFKDILEPWSDKVLRHYHWFSKKELVKLAKEAGFIVKESGVIKNKKGNRQNIYLIAEK